MEMKHKMIFKIFDFLFGNVADRCLDRVKESFLTREEIREALKSQNERTRQELLNDR